MRSRTGCQTCRSRKLKCDEVKPVCGQCRKGNRECQPSDGVVFRHQQNASMNGGAEADEGAKGGKLGSFYAYKNTFDDKHVWVDVPKNVTFFNVADPYNMETSPEPEQHPISASKAIPRVQEIPPEFATPQPYNDAPGLEALSAAATTQFDYMRARSTPTSDPRISPLASNNLDFILNPAGPDIDMSSMSSPSIRSPPVDPALLSPSVISSKVAPDTITDREDAFLLRHFGEAAGQWMDLFDYGCYFAHHVPVRARSNPLLKYSACAYAAKQLGRVRGNKAVVGGIASWQADMEIFHKSGKMDWAYIGAKYYEKAILLLLEELSNSASPNAPSSTPVPESRAVSNTSQSPQSTSAIHDRKRHRLSGTEFANHADETLAAAAILCVYEFLDNANTAWARHLSGTKSLFDMAEKEGMMPVRSPTSPGSISQRITPSRARRATFWNFARQDCLAAFINEGQTRLDTSDLGLWRAAGIHIDDRGFIIANNKEDFHYPDRQSIMGEDMISNALIWLMSKIINYIASGDSVDHVFPQDPSSPNGLVGINHMVLLERWKELEKELDIWYKGLPITFKPTARLPPIKDGSVSPDSPRAIFSEVWYSIPMCGSAMQSYYMARIILLMNKPHESTARRSTVVDRISSYRSIDVEIRAASHEICAIALGRPEGSVRIHMVQPLFVAGQCLTDTRERNVVLDLLRRIELDLGWATEYRSEQLLKQWGWQVPTV